MEEVLGYRIGRRIGRGGFAVVHEAEQLSLGRAVALKMLMPDQADERDLRRFERERLLLSRLSGHRHVVDVIDAGTTTAGRPFIVMRLYRRGSLAQALADHGPMPVGAAVDITVKLAAALHAAHDLGVVHRDVKPENVLVADDGEPALADFGISVLAGPEGATANLFTMAHAAPEVIERAEHSAVADLYALASTTYTMLAGHPPFTVGNQFGLMRAILEDPVPPIGRPDVPAAVEAAVVQGLAKRPSDRFPTVLAFAEALRQSLPVPDAGSGRVPDAGRARRWRGVLLGAGLVPVLVVALLGGTYLLGLPPGTTAAQAVGLGARPLVLAADISLQNPPAGGNSTERAIRLYLDRVQHQAGGHRIAVRTADIASPQHTQWDTEACKAAARRNVADPDVIAVIGPYNSGCAKVVVPILGKDAATALTSVSNGSTDPGLTRPWGAGEPAKYYPARQRTFARVVTTDDVQARAAVEFARSELGVTSVFVLDDGGVFGQNVARGFADAARAAGLTVAGTAPWNRAAASYTDLFAKVKASGAGAVFLGGAATSNAPRLVRDKVAVLGDNRQVPLLAADGFTEAPALVALPEAQGMYLTFPGLSPESIRRRGGAGSVFLDAYQAVYGADPPDAYALYAVAAVQVVLEAVARSDGTRAGVRRAIFTGPGITVPQAASVLGRDTQIDPQTGDVSIKDVTVEVIKRSAETFETVVTVP